MGIICHPSAQDPVCCGATLKGASLLSFINETTLNVVFAQHRIQLLALSICAANREVVEWVKVVVVAIGA